MSPGSLLAAARDLLLGSRCVSCGLPGRPLCASCAATLRAVPYLAWPTPRPPGLPRPYAVCPYDGPARAAVVAHKEHGVLALAGPLGRALASSVAAAVARAVPGRRAGPVLLVPPPTVRARVRMRGHDPLGRMLAHCVAALHSAGVDAAVTAVLERRREVADQAELDAAGRAANLAGAFAVRRPVPSFADAVVVVVDDVITTGATAAETVRAVACSGVPVAGVAVVAATRRRDRVPPAGPGTPAPDPATD